MPVTSVIGEWYNILIKKFFLKGEFIMGLFDKKYCDVCGEKIGLLGNRKLDDGNLCKDCAKKLSPFFSERRHSTVDEIKQQLAYREQNKINLNSFNPNRILGEDYKVYVDPETMAKTVVPLTLTAFNQVYEVVRTSQFGAYAWLETVRAAINNTHNFTDLAQVLETYEITL